MVPLLKAAPGIRAVAAVSHELGKPLTADIQDAYGHRLEEAIAALAAPYSVEAQMGRLFAVHSALADQRKASARAAY